MSKVEDEKVNDKQLKFLQSIILNPFTQEQHEHNEDVRMAREYFDLGYELGNKALQQENERLKKELEDKKDLIETSYYLQHLKKEKQELIEWLHAELELYNSGGSSYSGRMIIKILNKLEGKE